VRQLFLSAPTGDLPHLRPETRGRPRGGGRPRPVEAAARRGRHLRDPAGAATVFTVGTAPL
jgi:hypothetical protein